MELRLSTAERYAIEHYYRNFALKGETDRTLPVMPRCHGMFRKAPASQPILDIGCGMGAAVPILDLLGVARYHGVDPSLESIKFCRRTWPDLKFEQGEIRAVGDAYPEYFGGCISASMLMHIPRSDIQRALHSLRRSLVQGAPCLIETGVMKDGIGMLQRGGFSVTLYSKDELIAALELSGFCISYHMVSGLMQAAVAKAC